MLKSKLKMLKNRVVGTEFGEVTFDAEGVASGLTVEQQEKLGKLEYMEYTPDKKEQPKEDKPKETVPEEVKEETAPKKKAPAKKKTAKKEDKK